MMATPGYCKNAGRQMHPHAIPMEASPNPIEFTDPHELGLCESGTIAKLTFARN